MLNQQGKLGDAVGQHKQRDNREGEYGLPPPTGRKTGAGQLGAGGRVQVTPPQIGTTVLGYPGGAKDPDRHRGADGQVREGWGG